MSHPFQRLFLLLATFTAPLSHAGSPAPRGPVAKTWEEAFSRLSPVPTAAPAKPELEGAVVTGYQGWFGAEGDGSGLGWKHYGGKNLGPGDCRFDLWPDTSGLEDGEKYATRFQNADGTAAPLFSSYNPRTVERHFGWMREYGIDGAMLQRFGTELKSPQSYDFNTAVMENVRRGAEAHGRAWAVMYDLSGLKEGEMMTVVAEDWKRLTTRAGILGDRGYLHHQGKPLVAVWGIGFGDKRAYTLAECGQLIDFLKSQGNAVMVGIPYYWRDLSRDATADPALHELLRKADILSPWSIGRYRGAEAVRKNLPARLGGDIAWAREHRLSYLPVIFPGFSWRNLEKARGREAPLNAIPREGGAFLWQQAAEAKRAGAEMIYVAMFDEIDEGTAIMKGSNEPPAGDSTFMTYEGLPPDHYLWLTGRIREMLRGPAGGDHPMPGR